eukprot:1223739-Rhodomonas_salina.4
MRILLHPPKQYPRLCILLPVYPEKNCTIPTRVVYLDMRTDLVPRQWYPPTGIIGISGISWVSSYANRYLDMGTDLVAPVLRLLRLRDPSSPRRDAHELYCPW